MTSIAVPLMINPLGPSPEEAQAACDLVFRQALIAAEHGADLIEYRVDQVVLHPNLICDLIIKSPVPAIMTLRPSWEGGHFEGSEIERCECLSAIAENKCFPAYLDIELKAYSESEDIRKAVQPFVDHADTRLILSSHDFETRPADLLQRFEKMVHEPACDIVKLAWMSRSLRDNLEAFDLLKMSPKPAIALCMGEMGVPSRVLAPKFGAHLTFARLDVKDQNEESTDASTDASTDENTGTAPGQPGLLELKNLYGWDRIKPDTKVYGVIGEPVGHSKSPILHNTGFQAAEENSVYLFMPIAKGYEPFKATVLTWLDKKDLHFSGASVTIPHKENLLQLIDDLKERHPVALDPLAEAIGAANTLGIERDELHTRIHITNTDCHAAVNSILDAMNWSRDDLNGKRVALLGAGGVARAIVAGLSDAGARVVIYNRTLERAEQLAKDFAFASPAPVATKWENLCKSCCQVYINCTPIGMHPNVDESPMEIEEIEEIEEVEDGDKRLYFDTIYNPKETKLLKDAKAAGHETLCGLDMFVRQGIAQFELWTGDDYDKEEVFKIMSHVVN